MEIVMAIAPLVMVGGIVVFVIRRLSHNYNQGHLEEKKLKSAQNVLSSIIPLGMLFGCAIGVILGIFFPTSLLATVSLGTGIGYLFGYFAYKIFSKMESSTHK